MAADNKFVVLGADAATAGSEFGESEGLLRCRLATDNWGAKMEEMTGNLQESMGDHPHLLKVYRDKVGKLRYLWSIVTGGNFQVDHAYAFKDGVKSEMLGDWVVTIKDDLVIVTCENSALTRRTPIVVKPWKLVGQLTCPHV